eukprot:3302571-Rhodomonas_salina.2
MPGSDIAHGAGAKHSILTYAAMRCAVPWHVRCYGRLGTDTARGGTGYAEGEAYKPPTEAD